MLKASIVIGFLIVLSGFAGGAAFVATAVFGALFLLGWAIWQQMVVFVPEMHTGVVYGHGGQAYARFLTSGSHILKPFVEQLGGVIPVDPGSANGRCQNAQTIGGLPLTVEWTISYTLNPFRIKQENRPKLARNLPNKSGQIITKHANNILRHILSEYSIDDLTKPGIQRRLERQVRQQVTERLANAGFEVSRVMIGAIEMPTEVTNALADAHKRQLQADNEARALSRLQEVVSQFSENDMQRLIELERIYTLGKNGVTLMYSQSGDGVVNGVRR